MKTRLYSVILFGAIVVLLTACGGSTKDEKAVHGHDDESVTSSDEPATKAPAAFQSQMGELFTNYVLLKDAFVLSDVTKVKSAAAEVKSALGSVDMTLVTGEAHAHWMEYMDGIDKALIEIQGTDDLEAQRASFSILSDYVYKSVKEFGTGGITAYYEYCPMAFDDNGGYWLSDSKEIRNPYFGDKMLKCGSVKEVIE